MDSELRISAQNKTGRTVLSDYYATSPLKLLTLPAQADGTLRAIQMSASPGLLADDHINITITLAQQSALILGTQAFTRVLSMHKGQYASQYTKIDCADNSTLTYLPHPLVLHENSGLRQQTEIKLGENCQLQCGEILAAGRIANGESFNFDHLQSILAIYHHGQLIVYDNTQWHPTYHRLQVLGQMENYTHQLNYYAVSTAFDEKQTQSVVNALYQRLSQQFTPASERLLWGISAAGKGVICLRGLAKQAEILQELMGIASEQYVG